MNLTDFTAEQLEEGLDESLLSLEDRWILSLLDQTASEMKKCFTEYTFDRAATRAYEFFWNDFCAQYVELAKPVLFGKQGSPALRTNKQRLLVIVLCSAMRLMHPIAPFITEEIFSLLKERLPVTRQKRDPYTTSTLEALTAPVCMKAPYPEPLKEPDLSAEQVFSHMTTLVHAVRNIRAEMQLPPAEKTEILILGESEIVQKHQNFLLALTPTSKISFITSEPKSFGASAVIGAIKLIIPIPESFRMKEKQRLEKEQARLEKILITTSNQLDNKDLREKAPKELVEKLENTLQQTTLLLNETKEKIQKMLQS